MLIFKLDFNKQKFDHSTHETITIPKYAEAVLKFVKLNTAAQQREAVVQGRSLLPYRLRYKSAVSV
ncbi:MAG: hypothetical protein LBK06_02910 [Planctomycetaceae bacterium]|nr:hypothetical protein [Planctomycetaceae bacterium]